MKRRKSKIIRIVGTITIIIAGTLLTCLVGCANTIVPPANPVNPVTVFLIDYGRHTSLLLPDSADSTYIEYAYGDWDWFALDKSKWHDAFSTLLWPTQGALGRWEWEIEPSVDEIRRRIPCEDAYAIVVGSSEAAGQRDRLNAAYESQLDTLHHQARYQLDFVHHDENYHSLHNCNHVVTNWLEQMGCEVRGSAIFANFRVENTR